MADNSSTTGRPPAGQGRLAQYLVQRWRTRIAHVATQKMLRLALRHFVFLERWAGTGLRP
jgi:adenylate kinase family enzyme